MLNLKQLGAEQRLRFAQNGEEYQRVDPIEGRFKVRPMRGPGRWPRLSDLSKVLKIDEAYKERWGINPWDDETLLTHMRTPDVWGYVVEDLLQNVVGFMVYEKQRGRRTLLNFLVDPSYQALEERQAVRKAMLDKLISKFTRRPPRILVHVHELDQELRDFLVAEGFGASLVREFFEETGADAYEMVFRRSSVKHAAGLEAGQGEPPVADRLAAGLEAGQGESPPANHPAAGLEEETVEEALRLASSQRLEDKERLAAILQAQLIRPLDLSLLEESRYILEEGETDPFVAILSTLRAAKDFVGRTPAKVTEIQQGYQWARKFFEEATSQGLQFGSNQPVMRVLYGWTQFSQAYFKQVITYLELIRMLGEGRNQMLNPATDFLHREEVRTELVDLLKGASESPKLWQEVMQDFSSLANSATSLLSGLEEAVSLGWTRRFSDLRPLGVRFLEGFTDVTDVGKVADEEVLPFLNSGDRVLQIPVLPLSEAAAPNPKVLLVQPGLEAPPAWVKAVDEVRELPLDLAEARKVLQEAGAGSLALLNAAAGLEAEQEVWSELLADFEVLGLWILPGSNLGKSQSEDLSTIIAILKAAGGSLSARDLRAAVVRGSRQLLIFL